MSGWAWADPTSAHISKVAFSLLPFSICQQTSHLVYVKLRKWGLHFARGTDGFSCLTVEGKEEGIALATLGICVSGKETRPAKGACLWGQSAVCPQTIPSAGELPRLGF